MSISQAFSGLRRLSAEHKDGWGIARFDEGSPHIETRVSTANTCPRFSQLSEELKTQHLLAHIRLASVGSVSAVNTHPFFASGFAFMHNGTLQNFARDRSRFEAEIAPAWRAILKGDTDSERCFALFLTYLDGERSLGTETIVRSLLKVIDVAEAIFDGENAATPSAMNFMVSDGKRLVATRHRRTLYTARSEDTLFIASEHLWPNIPWEDVPESAALTIDEDLSLDIRHRSQW